MIKLKSIESTLFILKINNLINLFFENGSLLSNILIQNTSIVLYFIDDSNLNKYILINTLRLLHKKHINLFKVIAVHIIKIS